MYQIPHVSLSSVDLGQKGRGRGGGLPAKPLGTNFDIPEPTQKNIVVKF